MAKVEFIYDRDCPNIKSTRSNLLLAFSRLKIPANWIEWERNSEESPDYARKYGSPTILVNGQDLANIQPNDSNNCRLYNGSETPSPEVAASLERGKQRRLEKHKAEIQQLKTQLRCAHQWELLSHGLDPTAVN